MGFKHVLLLFLTSLSAIFPQDYANITVTVDLSDTVAETDDNFVCATIDWWPPEKCNYNDCPWGMTSVLNLDLNNPYLSKAIQGDDPCIARKITSPTYLGGFADTFRNVQLTIERHGPWSSAWVGEAGGVYNSGSPLVSNTFLNSIWYLDQLGMASRYNTKVYCRQTLIGGNYGLLDTHSFIPNPDYYSALLWHQLMGKGVLSVSISETTYLRGYAHCSKAKVEDNRKNELHRYLW